MFSLIKVNVKTKMCTVWGEHTPVDHQSWRTEHVPGQSSDTVCIPVSREGVVGVRTDSVPLQGLRGLREKAWVQWVSQK